MNSPPRIRENLGDVEGAVSDVPEQIGPTPGSPSVRSGRYPGRRFARGAEGGGWIIGATSNLLLAGSFVVLITLSGSLYMGGRWAWRVLHDRTPTEVTCSRSGASDPILGDLMLTLSGRAPSEALRGVFAAASPTEVDGAPARSFKSIAAEVVAVRAKTGGIGWIQVSFSPALPFCQAIGHLGLPEGTYAVGSERGAIESSVKHLQIVGEVNWRGRVAELSIYGPRSR